MKVSFWAEFFHVELPTAAAKVRTSASVQHSVDEADHRAVHGIVKCGRKSNSDGRDLRDADVSGLSQRL